METGMTTPAEKYTRQHIEINPWFGALSFLVILTAFMKISFHLGFWLIPLLFFAVGSVSALINPTFSLYLFVFLFPFINSSPGLVDRDYPFNYTAPSLFLLAGMVVVLLTTTWLKTGLKKKDSHSFHYFLYYYLFLLMLVISVLFVFLRWSNFNLAGRWSLGANTPVSPEIPAAPGSLHISFGAIFPIISLFLYFIAPYVFFLVKQLQPRESVVFKWLSYGFYVSSAIGMVQKISGSSLISDRLGKELKQFYGGFSDFNAFGFFSGVMFLWATYEIKNKNPLGYITLPVALAGGILSGSRTVFFFILVGMVNLFIMIFRDRKKQQRWIVVILILGVLTAVFFAGGTMKKRLAEGFSGDKSTFDTINAITNGRLWMTFFTLRTIGDYFIPGVGTGNFTFYLAYKNYIPYKKHSQTYLYDLPLNHYLLIFAENGLLGVFFFVGFMVILFRRSRKKLLLGTILLAQCLNNFFWFPEAYLLFWLVAALGDGPAEGEKIKGVEGFKTNPTRTIVLVVLSVSFMIVSNLVSFRSLHPVTWAQEAGYNYDYGFWYPESDGVGNQFRWSRGRAGHYLTLDREGRSPRLQLFCGAPLSRLKGNKQEVRVYWRGKPLRRITFTENRVENFQIESLPGESGFLEFHVTPLFNERKLGISAESRDLGIQLYIK